MENITIIKATDESPFIEFNALEATLKIRGKSLLENTFEFYAPIIEMATDFLNSHEKPLKVEFLMDYINSSTSRYIMELLMILEKSGRGNKVVWYYEDEDDIMEDKGRQLQSILNLDFDLELISVINSAQ